MKIKSILIAAALTMGTAAPVLAQGVDYTPQLVSIGETLKANPGNPDAAKDAVKAYKKAFKKNPEALLALGNSYLAAKMFDQADALADEMLLDKKQRNNGNIFILKGDIKAMQDDGGGAATEYASAMAVDPTNIQAHLRYASVYRKIDPKEAAATLEKIRTIDPAYPVDAEAGHAFYTAKNYDGALEYFKKADKASMDDSKLYEYALSAYYAGDMSECYAVSDYAAKKSPDNISFKRFAMWSAGAKKDYANAKAYGAEIMKSDEELTYTDHNFYAEALLNTDEFEAAIEHFAKAYELDNEKMVGALGKISEGYLKMGNNEKACEYAEKEIATKKAPINTYMTLITVYGKNNEFDKAVKVCDALSENLPSYAYWSWQVAASMTDGDVSKAYMQKIIDKYEGTSAAEDANIKAALEAAHQVVDAPAQ